MATLRLGQGRRNSPVLARPTAGSPGCCLTPGPLKNMTSSLGMMTFPKYIYIYGKDKSHVPNNKSFGTCFFKIEGVSLRNLKTTWFLGKSESEIHPKSYLTCFKIPQYISNLRIPGPFPWKMKEVEQRNGMYLPHFNLSHTSDRFYVSWYICVCI